MNVSDLVAAAAAAHPGRPAIVEADAGPAVTWADLEQRVAATAGHLHTTGVRRGDVVAVVLANSVAFAVAYYATLRAGATVVPVNPGYTPREMAHLLADSGAATALTDAVLAARVAEAAQQAGATVPAIPIDAHGLAGPPVGDVPGEEADVAALCYTSGTTGRPKGARLTHANLLANLDGFSGLARLALDEHDVLLGVLPFFHVFGLNVVLNAAARRGACVLAVDRFSPLASLRSLAAHAVSVVYGAPAMFGAWNAVPGEDVPPLPALRAGVSGADALPVATWQRFAERYDVELVEGYGLTETAPVLSSNAAAPATRPGTVGHALPNVALRIVDGRGAEVPTGTVGEIAAAGPNVFSGYHGLPDATAEVFVDGWFHTGDLGSFDTDGYLTIAGRLKQMVIVSGFNVYPREVEEALTEHPGVAEAAVIGVPDERTGERVRAIVVAWPGARIDADALADHCRSRLAPYKRPREYAVVDSLPRMATGKLDRDALRGDLGA